jgi:hypothetical protein
VNLQPVVTHLDAHTAFRQTGGAAAQDALHTARVAVESALATLVPAGAQTPPRWLRGSLVKFVQGQVWWMDEFEVCLVA